MKKLSLSMASLFIAATAACATADHASSNAQAPEPTQQPAATDFPDAEPPPPVECAEETKQIFVLATDKALYRFDPESLHFTRIGVLGCPTSAGTFSMAIDRRGTAYVEFTDGNLFAVDTRTAVCKPTPFRPGQTGFETFGMGYALNSSDTSQGETLYIAGAGLGALDTKTFDINFLGSLSYGRTELTGMGADLFAYSLESGVIVDLDKSTAASGTIHRTSAIDDRGAFAFAQWGGAFYLFTGRTMSIVTKYVPAIDTSTVVVDNAGILIVGAGSSTCAPSKPPR